MSEGGGVVHWAETHPWYLAGGIFGVGVIVVLLVTHKSAPAAQQTVSGYDPGYNAAVVGANANIQAAQLAAQQHSFDTNAALQAQLDAHATAVTLAHDQTGVLTNGQNVTGQIDIAKIQGDNATAIGLGQIGAGVATTQSQQAIAIAGINAGVADAQGATAFKLAQVAADTSRIGIMAGADMTKFVTQSNNDTALGAMAISSNQATQLAQINGGTAVDMSRINADVAVNGQNTDLAARMAGLAAGVQTAQIASNTTIHGQDTGLAGTLAGNALAWHGQDIALQTTQTNAGVSTHNADTAYLLGVQKTNTAFIRDVHQADLNQQLAAYKAGQ